MARAVHPDGHPVIRHINPKPKLPAGVTISAQRVRTKRVQRGGASTYRHNDDSFVIEGLNRDEAHRLMVLLLAKPGMEYVGLDLGRTLYPADVEVVNQ